MRLTAFSDVSLRIMMLLSALDPDQKLSTQKIADGVGTPYNHVAKSGKSRPATVHQRPRRGCAALGERPPGNSGSGAPYHRGGYPHD